MNSWIIISILIMNLHDPVSISHRNEAAIIADSSLNKVPQLPKKYLAQVNQKTTSVEQQVNKRADKVLNRLLERENKMKARLCGIDSVAANNVFTKSIDSLKNLKSGLKGKLPASLPIGNSYLDTLTNSLKFLNGKEKMLGASKEKLADVTGNIASLQGKLQQADDIKKYIREHKKQLKEQLSQYTGFTKDLQKINKEASYYGQQVNEYKTLLKDKKKAEVKAMEMLKKMPVYNDFIRRNSQLASLFNLGSSPANTAQSLEGLQTRTQVEQRGFFNSPWSGTS